jgi:hypothetical protein
LDESLKAAEEARKYQDLQREYARLLVKYSQQVEANSHMQEQLNVAMSARGAPPPPPEGVPPDDPLASWWSEEGIGWDAAQGAASAALTAAESWSGDWATTVPAEEKGSKRKDRRAGVSSPLNGSFSDDAHLCPPMGNPWTASVAACGTCRVPGTFCPFFDSIESCEWFPMASIFFLSLYHQYFSECVKLPNGYGSTQNNNQALATWIKEWKQAIFADGSEDYPYRHFPENDPLYLTSEEMTNCRRFLQPMYALAALLVPCPICCVPTKFVTLYQAWLYNFLTQQKMRKAKVLKNGGSARTAGFIALFNPKSLLYTSRSQGHPRIQAGVGYMLGAKVAMREDVTLFWAVQRVEWMRKNVYVHVTSKIQIRPFAWISQLIFDLPAFGAFVLSNIRIPQLVYYGCFEAAHFLGFRKMWTLLSFKKWIWTNWYSWEDCRNFFINFRIPMQCWDHPAFARISRQIGGPGHGSQPWQAVMREWASRMLGLFARIASVKADSFIFEQECFGVLDIAYVLRARVKPSTKWCQELIATDELMRLPVLRDTSRWKKGDFDEWCENRRIKTGIAGSIPDVNGVNSLMCFRFISADKARGLEGHLSTAKESRVGIFSCSDTPSKFKIASGNMKGFKLQSRFNGVDAQYMFCLQFVRSRLEQFLCGKTARAVKQSAAVRLQHSCIASACPEWYKIFYKGGALDPNGDKKSPSALIEDKGIEISGVWIDAVASTDDGKVGGCTSESVRDAGSSNEVRHKHDLRPRWCFGIPAAHGAAGRQNATGSVTQEQELHSLLCRDLVQGRLD